jgi:excinuclease UvrABC helicase subunit UvrB
MTEEDMQRIAEIIVDKIGAMQKAYEADFKSDMEDLIKKGFDVDVEILNDNDVIAEEVTLLQERLEDHIANEEFEKAGIIRDKIKYLKTKYKL